MISGNIEKFNSPIRRIQGKVELLGKGSTPTLLKGNPVQFDDAVPGSKVDIQLTSDTITDFANIGIKYGKNLVNPNEYIKDAYQTTLDGDIFTSTTTNGAVYVNNNWGNRAKFHSPGTYTATIIPVSENVKLSIIIYNRTGKEIFTHVAQPSRGYSLTFTANEDFRFAICGGDSTMYGTHSYKLQLEYGTVATAYEPYSEEPMAAEVIRRGKNLVDTDVLLSNYLTKDENGIYHFDGTSSAGSGVIYFNPPLPENTPIHFKFYDFGGYNANSDALLTTSVSFTDGTTENGNWFGISKNFTNELTFNKTKAIVAIQFYKYKPSEDFRCQFSALQVELGTTATPYEPYVEPQTFKANSEGVISTVALDGSNLFYSYNDVNIEATYQRALSADDATFAHNSDLISITVDRAGENKFFGFGVCQKIEVKVRDKDREYNPTADHYLKTYFDDLVVLPLFYISDVKRDENSNGLTITAYDMIETATKHTWNELSITDHSLSGIANHISSFLGLCGVVCDYPEFLAVYEDGINADGTETLREVLDDIAEITQTIYYIDHLNRLVFKRLDIEGEPVYTVDKSKYFTLKSEPAKTLSAIVATTELGDNVGTGTGETQYIRDNMFWSLRDDVGELVEAALNNVNGTTITPFDCSWRGNYLLEIGDKIAFTAKDNSTFETYFLNDKITYSGGLSQQSQWKSGSGEASHSNPSTLGEVLKQTYAKVDKANKQIDMLVSENGSLQGQLASLRIDTDGINATVSSMNTATQEALDGINDEISTLSNKVELAMTDEAVRIEIQNELANGVSRVETATGFTFDENGLSITKSNTEITTQITEDGMSVYKNGDEVLTANNAGVKAVDLHATTYLIVGTNSRFENYGSDRTGCFWIGG